MAEKHLVTWEDVYLRAAQVALKIHQQHQEDHRRDLRIYPIPNGGIFAALAIHHESCSFSKQLYIYITERPQSADIFIDDIIDSGETRKRYFDRFGKRPFFALYDKLGRDKDLGWVDFPWERAGKQVNGIEDNITRILQYIGEDPSRDGLHETPDRVARSLKEMTAGYGVDVTKLLKTFDAPGVDEMVLVRNIEVYSLCEHHLLPFFGKAHVAYIPKGKVVGLSKLARLVDAYARRLQVQERLTVQITNTLDEVLRPIGSACVIEAVHMCMACRGVGKQHSETVTSSLTGNFRLPEVRQELFKCIWH